MLYIRRVIMALNVQCLLSLLPPSPLLFLFYFYVVGHIVAFFPFQSLCADCVSSIVLCAGFPCVCVWYLWFDYYRGLMETTKKKLLLKNNENEWVGRRSVVSPIAYGDGFVTVRAWMKWTSLHRKLLFLAFRFSIVLCMKRFSSGSGLLETFCYCKSLLFPFSRSR